MSDQPGRRYKDLSAYAGMRISDAGHLIAADYMTTPRDVDFDWTKPAQTEDGEEVREIEFVPPKGDTTYPMLTGKVGQYTAFWTVHGMHLGGVIGFDLVNVPEQP